MSEITFDYAQIGGIRLHYARAGEGEKLVVLLHGFPESWYSWRHQLEALSDEYTVVAPDLRGFNQSDKPPRVADYEIERVADDVIGLIRHLGHEKAAVIGHDWGAVAAWHLGLNHPEYLWKLGALQVPPPNVLRRNFSFRQLLASWYMFFFQLPLLPELLLKFNDYALLEKSLRSTTYEPDVFSDADIAEYKKAWSEPFALTAMLNYYRANLIKRLTAPADAEARVKVPTVFIYGEKDAAILPETVKGIGEVVEAEYEEFHIPTSGHWAQQEAADAVSEILREFLAG
jgi:epoxide hydrolase 4